MKGLADLYLQQLKTGMATMLQYRASLVIWLIGNVLEPLIYLVVWTTVSRSTGGTVGGYGTRDFAAYYIVLMLVNQVTFSWVMYEFDYRIREGTFSADLLHPGLDDQSDDPAHEEIDADEGHELVGPPAAECRGVGEDEGQPGQGRAQLEGRIHEMGEEVGRIGGLAHDPDPEEDPEETQELHAPTAE